MGPQRTYMHVYTHIHTGLVHARTPCAPYVQSLSCMPYEVTSTHKHAHMEMEKGRSRQGGAELGKRQLSPRPQGGSWLRFQPPGILKTPPGPLMWQLHRHSQENCCPMQGKCLLCARHRVSWRSLSQCLFLTPTCSKGTMNPISR